MTCRYNDIERRMPGKCSIMLIILSDRAANLMCPVLTSSSAQYTKKRL